MVLNRKKLLNEFLSTHQEVHAFVIGIYCGLTEWTGLDSKAMQNPDVKAEIHYAKGGFVIGSLLRWAMIISMAQIAFL